MIEKAREVLKKYEGMTEEGELYPGEPFIGLYKDTILKLIRKEGFTNPDVIFNELVKSNDIRLVSMYSGIEEYEIKFRS